MRSDTSEEIARFDWVRRSSIQEAACLTFVRDNDVVRTAQSFGAVVDQVQRFDFEEFCEESFALQEAYAVIGVRDLGRWLLIVEDNGYQGARPEVLRRVSRGTEAISAFWNVNALTRFSYAADGEVRTSFEALMPEIRQGTHPDCLEDIRDGLPWPGEDGGGGDSLSLMLALSARITGDALTPELLSGEFLTYPVAEWPDDLPVSVGMLEDQVAAEYGRNLVDVVRGADRQRRLRAACTVAELVLDRCEWAEHPVIASTLSALESGELVDTRAINEAVREWTWQVRISRATSKVRNQIRATEVLRQATNTDSRIAVLSALHTARGISGIEPSELADAVLSAQWNA